MQNTIFDMGDFVNKKASAQTAFNFSFQNRPLPQNKSVFAKSAVYF